MFELFQKCVGIFIDLCVVLFLMLVIGVVVSFVAIVVLDIPSDLAFEFVSGFLIGATTLTALALLIIWRKA